MLDLQKVSLSLVVGPSSPMSTNTSLLDCRGSLALQVDGFEKAASRKQKCEEMKNVFGETVLMIQLSRESNSLYAHCRGSTLPENNISDVKTCTLTG